MLDHSCDTGCLQDLLARRDPDALEHLHCHTRLLERVLLRRYGWRLTADERRDIVADALLRAWTTGDRYNPALAPIESWLTMLAVFQARDYLRRHASLRIVALNDLAAEPAGNDDVHRSAPDRPSTALGEHLARLPRRRAVALELHYFEGQSVPDIARALHVSPGAVKSYLSRGRSDLRRAMTTAADVAG